MSHWLAVVARRGWRQGKDARHFLLEAELEEFDKMFPNKFVADMIAAGFRVEPYAGRRNWTGPATRASGQTDLQAIIRATTVSVTWDSLGMGYIVYPVEADRVWYDEAVVDFNWAGDDEDFDIGGEG